MEKLVYKLLNGFLGCTIGDLEVRILNLGVGLDKILFVKLPVGL